MIRILLADDHKLFREGIRSLFDQHPQMQVVAVADNGQSAVTLVRQHSPDVVIMDINMPELNGINATRRILKGNPKVKILALTMHSDRHFVLEMLEAGASGYMLKDADFEELIRAVQTLATNQPYLSPAISRVILEEVHQLSLNKTSAKLSALSLREREVLQLLAEGKSTREIATRLFLSAKTVETHRAKLMKKLDMQSLAELTKYAIREGLTSL
jgi:DNA-binding NarL/FixJ family response regulator